MQKIPLSELAPEIRNFSQNLRVPRLAWNLSDERASYQQGLLFPLVHYLEIHTMNPSCNRSEVTDDRDKVFALLGISNDASQLASRGVIPDYNKPCGLVYTETARAIIQAGRVDLLSFCQFPKAENIPSWVPDWRTKIVLPYVDWPSETRFATSGKPAFRGINVVRSFRNRLATLLRSAAVKPEGKADELRLEGCVVDTIEIAENHWRPELLHREPLMKSIYKCLRDVGQFYEESNAKYEESSIDIYKMKLDRSSAYFRVPIADSIPGPDDFANDSMKDTMDFQYDAYQNLRGYLASPNDVQLSREGRWYVHQMEVGEYRRFKRPFLTVKGFLGLCAGEIEDGDTIVIFLGGKFPYILRDNGDGTFKFIGEAYVHGIMFGEFMDGYVDMQQFVLV
jgi:hypothetical protein